MWNVVIIYIKLNFLGGRKMDFATMLGIIGIFVTVVLGYMGIRYTLQHRNYTKLTYLQGGCFNLFNSIVENLDGIEVLYEKNPVNKDLIMLKGTFINTGSVDIDSQIIHEPITLKLPMNCEWLKYKVVAESSDEEHQISDKNVSCGICDRRTIKFNWDLLKSNEFFKFDALIQIATNIEEPEKEKLVKDLVNSITINHRITNLGKVEKLNSEDFRKKTPFKKSIVFFSIMPVIISCFMIFSVFYKPDYKILYNTTNHDISQITISTDRTGMLIVKGKDNKYKDKISAKELFTKYKIVSSETQYDKVSNYILYGMAISMFIVSLITLMLLVSLHINYKKGSKYAKKLNI